MAKARKAKKDNKPTTEVIDIKSLSAGLEQMGNMIPVNLTKNPILQGIQGMRIDTSQDVEMFTEANVNWEDLNERHKEAVIEVAKIATYVLTIVNDKELMSMLDKEEMKLMNQTLANFTKDYADLDNKIERTHRLHVDKKGLITSHKEFNLFQKLGLEYVQVQVNWTALSESTLPVIVDLSHKADERLKAKLALAETKEEVIAEVKE